MSKDDLIDISNYCVCIYDNSQIGLFIREVEYYNNRRINIFREVNNLDNIGIIYTKINKGNRVTVHGTTLDKFRSKNGYYTPTCCIKKYIKLKDYYKNKNKNPNFIISKDQFDNLVNELFIALEFENNIRKTR